MSGAAMWPDTHRLVQEVSRRIEAEPSTFDQGAWLARTDQWGEPADEYRPWVTDDHFEGLSTADMVACGTVACVAGHTVLAALDLGMIEVGDLTWSIHATAWGLLFPEEPDDSPRYALFSGGADPDGVRQVLRESAEQGEWPMLGDYLDMLADVGEM